MADSARILLVEDEENLATGLKFNFELEGFAVDHAATVGAARKFVRGEPYAAIVLDVMLPDGDGFEFCREVRERGIYTPIIMLTARQSPTDRVTGLEAGADDYLPKPFELSELLARIRSLMRRRTWDEKSNHVEREPVLEFGDATINFDTHEVEVSERPVKLTQLELDLLCYFSENAGRVVSRQELLQEVWNLANYPNTRTVDNFVMRLRKHFERDPRSPIHFISVRGAGYKFVPEPSA